MFYRTVRTIHIILIIALMAACGLSRCAEGQNIDKYTAKRDYDFAVRLFDREQYNSAVTEFERFEFYAGDGEASLPASYGIACCYQHAREWPKAIEEWQKIAKDYPQFAVEADYRMAECSIASGDTATAKSILRQLSNTLPPDQMYASDTKFLAGIILLSQRDWRSAEEEFGDYARSYPNSPLTPSAETLVDACQKIMSEKRKSTKTAAFYSALLPGLGQAYAGRTGDGISSLIINTTIGLITANQIKRHNTFGTVFGILVFDTFYGGNIYGAAGAARAYNRSHEDKIAEKASQSVRDNITRYLGHPDRLKPYTLDTDLHPVP